jgi:hypothetical protein
MQLPAFYTSMPRRNQLILIHAVPLAVAIALGFWCYKSMGVIGKIDPDLDDQNNKLPAFLQRDTPDSIWTQIQAKNQAIKDSDAKIAEEPAITKKMEDLKGAKAAMNERLPKSDEKTEVRELLERLAREVPKDFGQVQVLSVNIQDSGAGGHNSGNEPRTVTYQVDLIGDQDGVIKYIDSIEKHQRFMAINRISIRSGGIDIDRARNSIIHLPHFVHIDIETKIFQPSVHKEGES